MFNLFSLLSSRTLFVPFDDAKLRWFWLIPNFFFHFSSKALDKDPGFGQNEEISLNPVQ